MWLASTFHHSPGSVTNFFSELKDVLMYIASLHDLVLIGDYNLHKVSLSSGVRQLTGILESFYLHHYVDFPIHILLII